MKLYLRILALLLVFVIMSGCYSLQYSYSPIALPNQGKGAPLRVGVLRLSDRTDSGYSDPIVDSMGGISQGIAQGLKDAGVFSKVIFCDEESQNAWSDADRLRRIYGIDAVLIGDVHTLRVNGGPNPVTFIVFSLGLGMLVGIPSGIGWSRMEFATSLKLIDLNRENILWQDQFSENQKETVFVSAYSIGDTQNKLYNRRLNRFVGDVIEKMSAHTPAILAASQKPPIKPIASSFGQPGLQTPLGRNSTCWAVIIGVSKYQNSGQNGLSNLIFADDDAKAFARSLQNLGWNDSHIKLLVNENATEKNIKIALESWLSKAGPNDQIILFWAGHGFPDPEDPEKVYFACYDTNINIPATGYRMDRVRTVLEERKAKNVILLADTCHAGKLITRGKRGLSIIPQIDKMQREQQVPKGWVFMVGADTDRQAVEHTSWTNGAFTHSLIKGINGEADGFQSAGAKDGIVTMGELKDYMNISMPDETQKVLGVAKRPIITTSTGDPDDLIVLFWSGHGFSDPEDPERVYFACYDTTARIPATGLRMDRVRNLLEELKSRNVLVMADTCHAGKIITRGDEKGLSVRPYIEKLKREKDLPKGWVFMVAADTDRKAIEDTSWANGAFTHCLMKGLSGAADGFEGSGNRDAVVTMGELRTYLYSTMPDETQAILGVAKRPVITTSSGDPTIWNLTLQRGKHE